MNIFKRLFRSIKYFIFVYLVRLSWWEYESCRRCGRMYKISFEVSDALWTEVVGYNVGGCYCPDCFVDLANKKGIRIEARDLNLWVFNLKNRKTLL